MFQQVNDTAKLISEQGILVTISSLFLVLSMIAIGVLITYFKRTNDALVNDVKGMIKALLEATHRQNDMLTDISEGLRPEIKERIKVLANSFFDLATFRIIAFIKRVKRENHIDKKDETLAKIRKYVANLHSDRKSKFDNFNYKGKPLSSYVNPSWIDSVADIVEREVYDAEPNDDRTFTNVKNVYDEIKLDFYERLKIL